VKRVLPLADALLGRAPWGSLGVLRHGWQCDQNDADGGEQALVFMLARGSSEPIALGASPRIPQGDALDRESNSTEGFGEVGNVDHRQKQAGDPEQVLVGEHRKKAKRRDELILNFLSRMGDVLGQMMKPHIQETERENDQYKEHSHNDHQHVGLSRL
jgi:hypothetical protein